MIEPVDHRAVSTLRRESADMAFDQHGFLPRPSAPVPRVPSIAVVVDHFAGSGDVLRLKCRSRIGYIDVAVDPVFVQRARFDAGDIRGKPAVIAAAQDMRLVLEHNIDAFRRRRPQPERCAIGCKLYAELPPSHAAPANARTERGGASLSAAEAKLAVVCAASAVLRICCQLLYSGVFGSLNAMDSGAAFSTMKIGACPCSAALST